MKTISDPTAELFLSKNRTALFLTGTFQVAHLGERHLAIGSASRLTLTAWNLIVRYLTNKTFYGNLKKISTTIVR
jgi:hypothetical protein